VDGWLWDFLGRRQIKIGLEIRSLFYRAASDASRRRLLSLAEKHKVRLSFVFHHRLPPLLHRFSPPPRSTSARPSAIPSTMASFFFVLPDLRSSFLPRHLSRECRQWLISYPPLHCMKTVKVLSSCSGLLQAIHSILQL